MQVTEGPDGLEALDPWVAPGSISILRGERATPMEELNLDRAEAEWVVKVLRDWLATDRPERKRDWDYDRILDAHKDKLDEELSRGDRWQ